MEGGVLIRHSCFLRPEKSDPRNTRNRSKETNTFSCCLVDRLAAGRISKIRGLFCESSVYAAAITQIDKLVKAQICVAAVLHFLNERRRNSVVSQAYEWIHLHFVITQTPDLLDELWVHSVVSHLPQLIQRQPRITERVEFLDVVCAYTVIPKRDQLFH